MKSLVQATQRIYYLPGEEETDTPYLYYIKGDAFGIAIDAGNSKQHVDEFYEELRKNELELPRFTIITHWHWDHTFGLAYIHGTSIGNQLSKEQLSVVEKWVWNEEAMQKREETGEDIPFCNECIRKVYPDLSKIHVVTVGKGITEPMIIDAGGIHAKLIPCDSTHSRDSLLIQVPEEKALFVGDADGEDLYENDGKIDKQRLVVLKSFIESLEFEHYFLGHDAPDNRESVMRYLEEELDKCNAISCL